MLFLPCPHCEELIEIEQINCGIFRHAIYKSNLQQVHPHLPKNQCDELVYHDQVYGCCKPFKIVKQRNDYVLVKCDYI